MNSFILGGLLIDIMKINLSTTPSIKLLFVYIFCLDRNTFVEPQYSQNRFRLTK
jgi:hypothetical protein